MFIITFSLGYYAHYLISNIYKEYTFHKEWNKKHTLGKSI